VPGALETRPRLVVAADQSVGRLQWIRQNLERLPPLPVAIVAADARRAPVRMADVVLLDAPCTGTGTLRRHADGRWRVGPADLDALVKLQAEMLHAAAALVAPDGLLIYATCSLEPEENEKQVDAFLASRSNFRIEPPGQIADGLVDEAGRLRMLPHVQGFDGAFAVRLRRSEGRAG
jgi:16S rRNA (cytosine967-C5)-methyltransferase